MVTALICKINHNWKHIKEQKLCTLIGKSNINVRKNHVKVAINVSLPCENLIYLT